MIKSKLLTMASLSLVLAASNAWAMNEDEASAKMTELVESAQNLQQDGKSQVQSFMHQLIEQGVPVDQAYDTAKTCVEQGIQGEQLVQFSQDIQNRIDGGMDVSASVYATLENVEDYQTSEASSEYKNSESMREEMTDIASGEFGDAGVGAGEFGAGAGAGAGAGDMEQGGAGTGTGAGGY